MSFEESRALSSLMAIRKVSAPSQSLKDLLASARSLVEEVEPTPGLLDPLVYAAEGLRVTIYERRIQAGQDANELLRKVHARMESPSITTSRRIRTPSGANRTSTRKSLNPIPTALNEVESLYTASTGGLLVRANKIIALTKPKLGTEFALVVDEGPGASALQAQHEVLVDAEKRMVAGRKLLQFAEVTNPTEEASNALQMPFMRAPFDNEEQRDAFTELLSAELPVHDIEIGPIAWRLNTVAS